MAAAGEGGALACRACGQENPGGSRFCSQCGERLEAPATAAPAVQIPEHLSQKIRDRAATLAGERKQVTVLFADVMGSMELAEQIDPERWREIMDRLFTLLADSVHRFEGTVDKFTGDGLMALFGAPIAHEDHAQRACYAALDMRETVGDYAAELRRGGGINLSLRIGINSGEVVVGSIGTDLSLAYTAIGHTVGLAQRMEALAEPGAAYLTEDTARLARGYVELTDLGEFEVKGASRPVRGYSLAGTGAARGRLDLARQRGFSRFVGRSDEIAELDAALDAALGGEGQAVGIVADAGVGKSRLCHEFLERCRARGLPVYEAQCQSHARTLPLLPVLQIMRAYFGIEHGDSDRAAREKIAGRLLLLDPAFADELGLVFDFLAVPDPQRPPPQMNPEARQRRLVDFGRQLVQAPGRDQPAITLIEDLHWIDPASEAFLGALIDALPGTNTLVLTNFRPEYGRDWSDRAHYRELRLETLGPGALGELFADLIGTDPSLDGLEELIRDRSGGNPFFIEEIVRDLADAGALEGERGAYRLVREIDELVVPPSVQAILAARIDRLDPAAKSVLQAASAIGAEFRGDLLAAATPLDRDGLDEALRELADSEFIYETALYPRPEYALRHPLTREVAHGSLLAGERTRVHVAIAQGIQELEPERLDEQASLIAQHYESAGEALEAARWHARAAGWAGFNDPAAALRHWQRVRELDPELPDGAEADALRSTSRLMITSVAWRLGTDVEQAREVFEEGVKIAERTGDRATLALLHASLGVAVGICGGDMPEYLRLATEAARIAEDSEDPGLRVVTTLPLVYPQFLAGRHADSLAACDRILELTAEDPQLGAGVVVANPRAWATSFRALPLMGLGRFAEARETLADGAELCRRWDRESLGWTHANWCTLVDWGGEPAGPELMAHARNAIEIAETIGEAFSRVIATVRLGYAQASAGELDEAMRSYERCLSLIAERGAGRDFEPFVHAYRAEAYAASSDFERAVAEAEVALGMAEERGIRVQAPIMRRTLAQILVARGQSGDAERAAALLDETETIARELGARGELAAIGIVRARLYEVSGDRDARERALAEALELAEEIDARGLIEQLRAEVDSAVAAGE